MFAAFGNQLLTVVEWMTLAIQTLIGVLRNRYFRWLMRHRTPWKRRAAAIDERSACITARSFVIQTLVGVL